jgi:hypothetical protein
MRVAMSETFKERRVISIISDMRRRSKKVISKK